MKYAEEIGWQYLKPEEALRQGQGDTGRFLRDTLETQLLRLNPGVLDAQRAEEVMRRLGHLKTTIEGNREALSWLHGEESVYLPQEKRERNVRLIHFEHL